MIRRLIVPALGLVLAGCGSMPPSESGAAPAGPSGPTASTRDAVVNVAAQQIGTPYRYGGNTRRGFDCSGLVEYTHRRAGIDVPRTTAEQWTNARSTDRRLLLPGDLLFFRIGEHKRRHVGIYEGDGVFIHAPSSGKSVGRASLDNEYWRRRLIGAKTFL
jgi:murein DD-endopeptidase